VGGVIEEGQTRAVAFFEVEDIEGRRILVEIVAVTPGIKTEQGTDQQPNGRFVRDNDDAFAGASVDDLQHRRQGPSRHCAILATPALADDNIYVRTEGDLYAFGK
jgi:hypothetical protein